MPYTVFVFAVLCCDLLCYAVLCRDLVLAVRADEACHGHVNHTFADMKATDVNPFNPGGKSMLP